jgi:hypothetical protein
MSEQPEPPSAPTPAARLVTVPWEGLAVVAAVSLLAAIGLAGAGGATLIAAAIATAVGLAVVAVLRRSATVAVVAVTMAATALALAVGLSLGDRVRAAEHRGVPFPAVVGLRLERAKALFDRHGPVHYEIKKVPYGARDTVLRATGYSTDGTYSPGSTITLVIGTRAPRP